MPTLHINGESISADPGETILGAALRAGIDFPFRCRVGGCGACKCQVTAGSVRELTESGYLLTQDELAQGTVLACQSAPQGDVRVSVVLPETAAPTPVAEVDTRPVARPWHYARYALFHALGLFAVFSLLGGGWVTTLGMIGVVSAYLLGDTFAGDDTASLRFTRPAVLTGLLWAGLPLMALIAFTTTWTVCTTDPLGFGAAVTALTGIDVISARDATAAGHHVSGLVLAMLANGLVSLIAGHELVHRTWDRPSLVIGRLLYAFAFDANFSIEHVYGHHRYVATAQDPATAPRGRSVYAHVVISTVRGNVSSWHIEAERLRKRGLPLLSWHNVFLRGHALNLSLVAVAWAMGGALAAGTYLAMALGGKAILEMVNYLEHYGLVRAPDAPVAPHHSWNTNRRVSSWAMFNLTRHSHHHAQGEVPFHELRPFPDAPLMINGYLATMFVAMIPPLWHRLMTPKVQEWDARYASDEERVLATAPSS